MPAGHPGGAEAWRVPECGAAPGGHCCGGDAGFASQIRAPRGTGLVDGHFGASPYRGRNVRLGRSRFRRMSAKTQSIFLPLMTAALTLAAVGVRTPSAAEAAKADKIVVVKHEQRLYLMRDGE